MQRYTPKERAEMFKLFYENQSSVVATQRAFRAKFRGQTTPNGRTLRRLLTAFLEIDVAIDVQRNSRQRTNCSNENIERVRQDVNENAETSTRKRAAHLGLSDRSELVWKACISNRMALHAIHRLPQSLLCVKCFLDASY